MRILVVSPIASHPRNQGNSARIFALCSSLQALGHVVHFLYYPMEGLTPGQRLEMSAAWDAFHTLPCRVQKPQPDLETGYRIDDWYEPALGALAATLHRQWRFDAVLVNYVWISAVLDALPPEVVKLIDAHDVFGDRHRTFQAMGLPPAWFYTTPAEEARGLRRADLVIAIQSHEAAQFASLLADSGTRVATLGHGVPSHFLPRSRRPGRPCVGYLGSDNPFNVLSLRRFILDLQAAPGVAEHFRFVMAGMICNPLRALPSPFEHAGPVADTQDFYAGVDIVVNPMLGGSGLKIKTLEGLAFGLPVLGTAEAWVGIASPDEVWPSGPAPSPTGALAAIARDPTIIGRLRQRCQETYGRYLLAQLDSLQDLFGADGWVQQRCAGARPVMEANSR